MMSPSRRTRRKFLKTTAALSMMMPCAPLILGATDKAGNRLPIIGSKGFQYEVRHDCLQLPPHIRWQETHGVAVDSTGLIYIKHRTKSVEVQDAIVVFDAAGKYVRSFGKEFHGGGHGIDIRRDNGEEFLYLCDNKGYIAKSTLSGEIVWKYSAPQIDVYRGAAPFVMSTPGQYDKGKLFSPTNVAFAPDGSFYVGDGYGSHYVIQYDKDAKVIRHFGGKGSDPGKFDTPHGLWWDDRPGREPALVVADRANARLQYLSAEGKHLSFVNDLLFPAAIDIRGEVMLVPDLHARITLFDKQNKVITHLGDDTEWRAKVLANNFEMRRQPDRWLPGKFVHPHDACFDRDGNIYVAEWVTTGRVTFLRQVS